MKINGISSRYFKKLIKRNLPNESSCRRFFRAVSVSFHRLGYWFKTGLWITNRSLFKYLIREIKRDPSKDDKWMPLVALFPQGEEKWNSLHIVKAPPSINEPEPGPPKPITPLPSPKPAEPPPPEPAPPPPPPKPIFTPPPVKTRQPDNNFERGGEKKINDQQEEGKHAAIDAPLPGPARRKSKAPIYYKPAPRPKDVNRIKKDKILLGRGNICKGVYEYPHEPGVVVKKGRRQNPERPSINDGNFFEEYGIGSTLNHPTLIHYKELWIKQLDGGYIIPKIKMEKVEGESLAHCRGSSDKIETRDVLRLINQAKECCLYLLSERVSWSDLNPGNLFITPEKNLKIIDFGNWSRVDDRPDECLQILGIELLAGSIEIIEGIIKGSVLREKEVRRELESDIMFPEPYFWGLKEKPHQVITLFGLPSPQDAPWAAAAKIKFEVAMNEKEVAFLLAGYFDAAAKMFSRVVS